MPQYRTVATNAARVAGRPTTTMRVARGKESHQRTTLMVATVG